MRVGFCEQNAPNLRAVLAGLSGEAVVTPLLLADAYHARVDIPAIIEASGAWVRQAAVLGEDDRLIGVLRQRVTEAGASRLDAGLGVVAVAVGSSRHEANAATARVAERLADGTHWATEVAFATGAGPTVAEAAAALRARGAQRIVIAPWFLAHGRITDRVAEYARAQRMTMAQPLAAHPLVAATVLDRYQCALAGLAAA